MRPPYVGIRIGFSSNGESIDRHDGRLRASGQAPCDLRHTQKHETKRFVDPVNCNEIVSSGLVAAARARSGPSADWYICAPTASANALAAGRQEREATKDYCGKDVWITARACSIAMPSSAVISAVPIKGIIDPTRVRTVWRAPKRVSPHGANHAADDCSRGSGDDQSGSDAKGRADCVRPRTRRRSRYDRDGRQPQNH